MEKDYIVSGREGQKMPKNATKRKIKNKPNRKSQQNNKYHGSKVNLKIATQKSKARLAAIILATGITMSVGGSTLLSSIANRINQNINKKQAIEIVANNKILEETINKDSIMSQVIDTETIIQLQTFTNAIETYKELKLNQERTLTQEKQFTEAFETIINSKQLVIDTYTDIIKTKVAKALNITESFQIEAMEITAAAPYDTTAGYTYLPLIKLQDGTKINDRGKFLNSENTMDKKLSDKIIEARKLLDENQVTREVADEIIKTYNNAMKFSQSYEIEADKNGDLTTKETKEKEQNTNKIQEEPDDER